MSCLGDIQIFTRKYIDYYIDLSRPKTREEDFDLVGAVFTMFCDAASITLKSLWLWSATSKSMKCHVFMTMGATFFFYKSFV